MFSASPFFKTLQKVFADVWFMPVWGRGGEVKEQRKKIFFLIIIISIISFL